MNKKIMRVAIRTPKKQKTNIIKVVVRTPKKRETKTIKVAVRDVDSPFFPAKKHQ